MLGDSYDRMGDRFEDRSAAAYARIVKDYPLSARAPAARQKLEAMKRPVPEADPVAYARMKYELENRTSPSRVNRIIDGFKRNPDTSLAAKGGTPSMTILRPGIPVSVPQSAGATTASGVTGTPGTESNVAIGITNDTKELDTRPDARANPPGAAAAAGASPAAPAADQKAKPADAAPAAPQQPFATNHPLTEKDKKAIMKKALEKVKRDKKAADQAAKAAKKKPPAQPAQPQTQATPPGPSAQPPAQTPQQEK
jgi:outer membrane protein assembly factor BamD